MQIPFLNFEKKNIDDRSYTYTYNLYPLKNFTLIFSY